MISDNLKGDLALCGFYFFLMVVSLFGLIKLVDVVDPAYRVLEQVSETQARFDKRLSVVEDRAEDIHAMKAELQQLREVVESVKRGRLSGRSHGSKEREVH